MGPEIVGEDALVLMQNHASSIDESMSPSLVRKLFMIQQPRLFMDFTCAAFPTLYFHNRFRSDIAFPEYMMDNFQTKPYQYPTMCCLSTVYLASLTKDTRLLRTSRHMYGEALRRINQIIDTDEALSDDLLGTVMMLMIYELYARTTPDAWIKHCRGITDLMLKRGVEKHMSGFGRSCYYAFRGFIIAYSLHEEIPCFLDGEEWQNFAIKVQEEDSKKSGEWSVFVHTSESIFMELVKCPRYIYDIRQLKNATPRDEIISLVTRIHATCAHLRSLRDELQASIMYHFQKKQGIEVNAEGFVGPAPALFPDTNPTILLQGATHCINALEKLLRTIRIDVAGESPDSQRQAQSLSISPLASSPSTTYTPETEYLSPTPSTDSVSETISSTNPSPCSADGNSPVTDPTKMKTITLPFRLVSEIGRGPMGHDKSGGGHRPVVWLDRIACSMGMMNADIEEEQQVDEHGMLLETIVETVETLEQE